MPLSSPDALSLLREIRTLLQEEEVIILASPEDASYFRKAEGGKQKAEVRNEQREVPTVQKSPQPPLPQIPLPSDFRPPPPQTPPPPNPLPSLPTSVFRSPSSLKALFAKIAPDVSILDTLPNDAEARKIGERWKTKNRAAPLSLLFHGEPKTQRDLLENISKALDVSFAPARLIAAEPIEKEKAWEAFLSASELKWIIACDSTLWQLPSLMQFYRENPTQGVRTLGKVPLFLLPDLSLYLKDPLLKRSLWKALCQKLSS